MPKKLKFLLVCEGPTDIAFLKRLNEKIAGNLGTTIEIQEMSPQRDATSDSYPPHGWTGVRSWCKANRVKSENEINSIDSPFKDLLRRKNWKALVSVANADGLIVQMDTDIAEEIRDLPYRYTEHRGSRRDFCHEAVLYWMREEPSLDSNYYILLPTYALETWLLAVHEPNESVFDDLTKPFNYEELPDAESRLLELGYQAKRNAHQGQRLKKKEIQYLEYADKVYEKIASVKERCREAHLFYDFLIKKNAAN